MTPATGFDAVVLAGGRGRRLGGARKPEVVVGGRALLDHALAAVADADRVVVVGPGDLARPGVATVLEDPPDGGPVAGLAAGLAFLGSDGLVAVLACDVPRAGAALPALLAAAADDVDGARLVSADGRPQHLVAVYRAASLARSLAALPAVRGASMRELLAGLRLVDVPDTGDAAADADTWADVERLDAELGGRIAP
ncbi:molybdenum cofactor guanylyltransferase [Cellulomonas sp. ICMP 17802]|uniref:molybdenum cofactor guanylyltransferase n=1 Tax=Cellulomonas sp. ICMP 17802 TaxID=3239199 RepID=UPI00351BA94D